MTTRAGRRSLLWDGVLALAVALSALPALRHGLHDLRALPFALALAVPLLWRRRAPAAGFGVLAAVAFVQWLVFRPVVADLALLVAFATVATRCRPRVLVGAAAVMELGVVLAVARYTPSSGNPLLAWLFLTGLVTAAGALGIYARVRAAYVAEVELRLRTLEREQDRQAQLAAATERTRIARELHDIVAHNLAVLVALTDGASFTVRTDPARAERAVAEASAVGRTALRELRQALGVLRADDAATDLAPAPGLANLDGLIAPLRHTGVAVTTRTTGATDALPAGLQLAIYRIVQESLTNVVKHAVGASRVDIAIAVVDGDVTLAVSDDGAPTTCLPAVTGSGIDGMRERAAAHHGTVRTTATAQGWCVVGRFPAAREVPVP